ncbi:MAG: PEGA domain-containing protein [Kofleriaceae bacterium]
MSTGPIYLVSACASGEEFVAAFRRYADRNGLFIPIGEPIAVGKRGRFALTLSDGGVMIEGDGEVISAAKTPSVLHGRIGMTIRFAELDDQSKTVIVELEKARLAMKPPAPSVPPRPAEIPATPRATPPAPSGRIDVHNALAECVVIGDVDGLAVSDPKAPPKAGPRFVVPTIPPVAGARPKTPSVPPILPPPIPRPKAATAPPLVPPPPPAIETPVVQVDDVLVRKPGEPPVGAFSATMPAIDLATLTRPPPAEEPTAPFVPLGATAQIMDSVTPDVTPESMDAELAPILTPTEMAVPQPPPTTAAMPIVAPVRTSATPPPLPIVQPPIVPATPRILAPIVEDEPTDLTEFPVAQIDDELQKHRKTELGVAVSPEGATVLPAVTEPGVGVGVSDTELMPALVQRAVAVEELTPSGDWTMTPGADGPTIAPREPDEPEEPKQPRAPTGDWLIAVEPSAPDGWSEPSKPMVRVVLDTETPAEPLPVVEIPKPPAPVSPSSRRATQPTPSQPRPRVDPMLLEEPKVQIDPTLIEPLLPMPVDEPMMMMPPPMMASMPLAASSSSGQLHLGAAASAHELPMMAPPGSIFTPPPGTMANATGPNAVYGMQPGMPPRMVTDGGTGFFRDSGEIAHLPVGDSTAMLNAGNRRRRIIVIVASAAVAVIAGIVLLIVFGIGGKHEDHDAVVPDSAPAMLESDAHPGSGAAIVAAPADAAAEVVAPPDAAVAVAPECFVDVTTTPAGAEIVHDKEVLGTSPMKLPLPCGAEIKLTLRKARLGAVSRMVTPTEDGAKLKVSLGKVMFSVKVNTQPAGATVTLNGKSLGVTPTTVRLPAFEASSITLVKEGYTSETQRITPKQNNQSIQAQLKKKRR